VQTFRSIVDRFKLDFGEYLLEITESAYSSDMTQMLDVIGRLKDEGFRIEMDDFGSGYSSLTRLTDMPIDVIKLDMSFIRGLEKDSRKRDLVELIIAMAKKLGAIVVAEGVELEEQFNILKGFGCDVAQGYYFSKPVPADEFGKFIEQKCRQED
jgi:EAL domain-containing protein (putative c-di-GMP-specific phosphodiesterase class I)